MAMSGPVAALLDGGARLHLQHGPIDLILGADATRPGARERAFAAAAARFDGLLERLVAELPLLRAELTPDAPAPTGAVARRMYHAALPHASRAFVTCMAGVAGAVADEILAAMIAAEPLRRAYVNNGGDIALHLAEGESFVTAIAALDGRGLGRIRIERRDGIGGIATSGRGGRSLSLGIAESVTVLARSAASADVAATLIASAVDLPGHPAIRRRPACDLQPDSDLGARPAVTAVAALDGSEARRALAAGASLAREMLDRGDILGAALWLQNEQIVVGRSIGTMPGPERVEHAEA